MSQSQVLFSLQQIDSRLDQVNNRTLEIDKILSTNIELEQAQARVAEAQKNLDSNIHDLHIAERHVQDQFVKIEQTEAALYGGKIRIPKELQDLQNEAIALKKHLVVLEDRQLDHMEKVEIAQEQLSNALSLLDKVNAAWVEQTAQLHNEQTHMQTLRIRLESERAAVISPISSDLLLVYENLRKQRNGVAVVRVSGKSCSACGTTLSPAIMQSVQSAQTTIRCPTCSRILYSG
jgi:hypothetical protein